jgi:hypothetical protein
MVVVGLAQSAGDPLRGLADPTQPGVDEASLVAAGAQALDQRLHVLEDRVAAAEDGRLAAGSWRVRVIASLGDRVLSRTGSKSLEGGERARAAAAALAG